MGELDIINNDIISILNEIGSETVLTIRGNEHTMKSTIVDPRSLRQRGILPDWAEKSEKIIYVSYASFLSLGLLDADIKDIGKVFYKNNDYTAMGATPYGFLEDSATWIYIGLAR